MAEYLRKKKEGTRGKHRVYKILDLVRVDLDHGGCMLLWNMEVRVMQMITINERWQFPSTFINFRLHTYNVGTQVTIELVAKGTVCRPGRSGGEATH